MKREIQKLRKCIYMSKKNKKIKIGSFMYKMHIVIHVWVYLYSRSGPTFDLDPLFRFLRVDELIPKTFNIAAAVAKSVSDARERLFIPIIDCLSGL